MSDGNAGREALPAGPERPSITSPAELAVHPGRELVGVGGGRQRVDGPALRGGPGLAGGARLGAEEHAERLRPGPVQPVPPDRRDPLHIAAFAGACEVVAVLLEGGDPDDANATTAMPLHDAAAGHSGSAAAVLAGAGRTSGRRRRRVSLRWTRRRGRTQSRWRGCCWTTRPSPGRRTPRTIRRCIRAASGDAASVAAVLLDHGADISARAGDGATPLHVAALKKADRGV